VVIYFKVISYIFMNLQVDIKIQDSQIQISCVRDSITAFGIQKVHKFIFGPKT